MNKLLSAWLAALLLSWIGTVKAQTQSLVDTTALHCLQMPLTLASRVQHATLIIEAEAGVATASWDASHKHIYTTQPVQVLRVLKGTPPLVPTLPLLLEGGQVGLDQQVLTNTLRPLVTGQRGIFFLTPAPWQGLTTTAAYTPYGSEQGVIMYDAATDTATDLFDAYTPTSSVINKILQLVGRPPLDNRHSSSLKPFGTLQRTTAAITGFSPTALAAGVGAVLTIQGSGFGTSRGTGSIDFKNADNGGATTDTPRPADYLSWNDTQIRVRVPSLGNNGHAVGSGILRIVTADGNVLYSNTALTITYAITNVSSTASAPGNQPNHVATNTAGGLSFHFGTSFQNSAAAAPWQRALTQWRCSTGINWTLDPTATLGIIANDDQNVIAFDPGTDLPAGVLGRTITYYKGCYNSQGDAVFYIQEIDQEYANPSTTFFLHYGPALATGQQLDFESVALHELGHAQQLAHIIQLGATMHYALGRGQNVRTLTLVSDIAGGRRLLRTHSFRNYGCSGPALLPAPLTTLASPLNGGTLTFTTINECFLTGFVLERSLSADTTTWQAVATTPANLTGGQYSLVDPQPAAGLRYYRLGLRRPDGSIDYAAPAPSILNPTLADNQLFPNPVTGTQAQLSYIATANDTITLRIYDELGRVQQQLNTTVRIGVNVLAVDVNGLVAGIYLLQLTTNQGLGQRIRFVRI